MKKWVAIILAVMLILCFASVAMAAAPSGAPVSTVPTLPSGEQLYVLNVYTEKDAQFQVFEDYLKQQNVSANYRVFQVLELGVYDSHLDQIMPNTDYAGTAYALALSAGSNPGCTYSALHQSSASGGIETFSDAGAITTTTGFGLFAIVEKSPKPFLDEVPCTGLPSGEQLYKYAEYGAGTTQFQLFQDYMTQKGIAGTLDHVWELIVWDEHLGEWVPNSLLTGSYTVSTTAGYTVLHNSSMSGGVENLGNSASFTTTTGFGLFGFVKPAAAPTPTPTAAPTAAPAVTSPKTDDHSGTPMGWILLAAGLSVALAVVVKKTHKTER